MNHYYKNVKGLNNVAVSRTAQSHLVKNEISIETFNDVLLNPTEKDVDKGGVLWRQKGYIRLVIVKEPEPYNGAMLVTAVYLRDKKSGKDSKGNYYYPRVDGLGNVAVSTTVQRYIEQLRIPEELFVDALLKPVNRDCEIKPGIIRREKNGIRLYIVKEPKPFSGAMLVTRVEWRRRRKHF